MPAPSGWGVGLVPSSWRVISSTTRATAGRSSRLDAGVLHAEVRYDIDGHEWQQPFTARILDDTTRREMFAREGLEVLGWLDRPGWFLAKVAD